MLNHKDVLGSYKATLDKNGGILAITSSLLI